MKEINREGETETEKKRKINETEQRWKGGQGQQRDGEICVGAERVTNRTQCTVCLQEMCGER